MENTTQTKAVVKSDNKRTVEALLNGPAFLDAIKKSLPAHLKPDRFVRVALTAMTRTPKLRTCSQESLFECLLNLSQTGLEPDGRRAHLIPYGDKCTLIIDYKGFVELAIRSGNVSNIHADVVRENDEFEYDMGQITKHKPQLRGDRGEVYAVYARVLFKDGTSKCEVMDRDEVEAVRKRSKAANAGPWVTDWNEMAKKTVFRRLSKWIQLSPEIRDAVEADELDFRKSNIVESPVIFAKPNVSVVEDSDDVPMDGPTPQAKEAESKPQATGIFAPAPKVQESNPLAVVPGSPQAEISEVLEGAGVTFESFRKWLADSDGIATDSWESWAQVPKEICEGFRGGQGGKRLAKLVTIYGKS